MPESALARSPPASRHGRTTTQYPCFIHARVWRAHSRFPGHALTPTGVMAIRCKQFHLPDL